jgi:hypothetical protein
MTNLERMCTHTENVSVGFLGFLEGFRVCAYLVHRKSELVLWVGLLLMGWERKKKQRKTECGNGVESEKVRVVSLFSDIGMHLSH